MADDAPKPRMMTEDEAYAISAANVKRETADLTEKVERLEREKAELQSKLDVADTELATVKAAREKADQDLADFKTQVETEREIASRMDTRVGKVREVAKSLKDDFFTDERKARWAAMDDAAFEGYLAEIAAFNDVEAPTSGAPRQTAMAGAPAATATGTAPVPSTAEKLLAMRRGGGN